MINIIPNWHPIFVHFTIGLLSTAVVLYIAAMVIRKTHSWHVQWLIVANWCLWIGTIFAVVTATAGWFAFNSVAHDAASHVAMTTHRNWALSTLVLFLLIGIWSVLLVQKKRVPDKLFLTAALVAAVMLMITGWHGGEAVYRYGLGVLSLPDIDEGEYGHNHHHDDKSVNTHATEEVSDIEHNHEDEHQHSDGHNH